MNVEVIRADEVERWTSALRLCGEFDCYHLPEYHCFSEKQGEGRGILVVFSEHSRIAALPILVRQISAESSLGGRGARLQDATSVYGYPGPLFSREARDDPKFLDRVGRALSTVARDMKLISMFSRLSPLTGGTEIAKAAGAVVELGQTVSIDLSSSPERQWSAYRRSHRYEISKARQRGLRVFRDQEWAHFEDFVRLYTATMEKVEAAAAYSFRREYFLSLREALGVRMSLFVAEMNGCTCSAALFIKTGGIIQYHLSGTDPDYARLSPSKVILDEARLWGIATGASRLHLGGGVGSREDSLFRFKAGFSLARHRFFVWKWIVQPEVYAELSATRQRWRVAQELGMADTAYFPQYRA